MRMRLVTRIKKYIAAAAAAALLGGGYGVQDLYHGSSPQLREVAAVVMQKGKNIVKKVKNLRWEDIETLARRFKRAYDAF